MIKLIQVIILLKMNLKSTPIILVKFPDFHPEKNNKNYLIFYFKI